MPAYCIFDVKAVTDEPRMNDYRAAVRETVTQFGGRYVALGGRHEVVEGNWQPTFLVLIEFPSLAQAKRWYDSEEYRALKALRLGATIGDAVFVEGLPAAA